jgi:hypothetical protein
MEVSLPELVCEIAEESGYRNWSPSYVGSYKEQGNVTLRFIKLFDSYVAKMLLRDDATRIGKEALENIARVKMVVVKNNTVILPASQPTGSEKPAEVIDIHSPDSIDRIRAWFKS